MKSPISVPWFSCTLACALAACAAPPAATETAAAAQAPVPGNAPEAASTERRDVSFACRNGEQVQVRFFPAQGVAVLVRGGNTTELQGQPAASGFLYSSGPVTIRGQGDEMTMEIGRMKPVQCEAR